MFNPKSVNPYQKPVKQAVSNIPKQRPHTLESPSPQPIHTSPKPLTPKSVKPYHRPVKRNTTPGGSKEYACEECNKPYSTIGNLNQHKMIHAGYKPFCMYSM